MAIDHIEPTQPSHAGLGTLRATGAKQRIFDRSLTVLAWVVLGTVLIVVIYPLIWMVLSGFKSNAELFSNTWGLPGEWRWSNYGSAFNAGVFTYLANSLIVTLASVVGVVFVSAWAAYGLTRLRIPGATQITFLLLGGMMLAPAVALIPLFGLLQTLGLYDSRTALVLLYVAYRIPFTLFLIRAYMLTLPKEVEEAARVDGANHWQIFFRIILPMIRPIVISAALVQALFAWNEFPFALVFISSSDLKTLPVGLLELRSAVTTNWPVLFAGLTLASLPMMLAFFFGQRHFIRGLAEGANK